MGMQAVLRVLYPPACFCCGEGVASGGLCGPCWRDTPFVTGAVCDRCGTPVPGAEDAEACDDCLRMLPPWDQGRAALIYGDNARRMVLALKHGDRQDLIAPAARWMAQAVAPILRPDMLVAPVPLHWTRLIRRRFNQSALLATGLARATGLTAAPALLTRTRRTASQDGRGAAARFENVSGAMRVRRPQAVPGRAVLLVDDVMTTGATLAAAAEACRDAGAAYVAVAVLARVVKTP
ncbi:ComF family protein [Falsirhodobacter halotolerans]|uniref:ComF family protein n=1 Tax=Falsirhodobacter halotolerans TaxID=1146892 RepID=UPI001FD5FF09|nr:double zinc ribbon domain-containing protein [Falsirhodobacter halotolerans]MCJ8138331.1 double zinc ribbon domain-containing protein [Falsirhodobacter halotolerans]